MSQGNEGAAAKLTVLSDWASAHAAPGAARIDAYVDSVTLFPEGAAIQGWARNSGAPDESVRVRACVGEDTIAYAMACDYRADLAEKFSDSGAFGFRLLLPQSAWADLDRLALIVGDAQRVGLPAARQQVGAIERAERVHDVVKFQVDGERVIIEGWSKPTIRRSERPTITLTCGVFVARAFAIDTLPGQDQPGHGFRFDVRIPSLGFAHALADIRLSYLDGQEISLARWRQALGGEPPPHAVDAALIDRRGMGVVVGWVQDAPDWRLSIAADPSIGAVANAGVATYWRPDASDHLAQTSVSARTSMHGFCLSFRAEAGGAALYLRGVNARSGAFFSTPLQFAPAPTNAIYEAIINACLRAPDPEALISEMLPPPPARPASVNIVAARHRYGPDNAATSLSVIVPFYRETHYLLDHIYSQARAFDSAEWILVCDDPSIAREMKEQLDQRKGQICRSTTLLILDDNYGYATANNVGAAEARGEALLLLNSDVLWDSFEPFAEATYLLMSQPDLGCIGFTLQFEDGTIQHEGIDFAPYSPWGGRFIPRHPRKGVPFTPPAKLACSDVDAVTGAALMLRRPRRGEPVFDASYVQGDFEDADLCMRLRSEGMRIALMASPGLYHLERQSMRHVGSGSARAALTRANCVTFNKRWRQTLGGA